MQVYRQPRSAEVCCQQADAEREKARQCQVEVERTRAQSGPGGLIGLLSQGLLDRGGVPSKKILDEEFTRGRAHALKVEAELTKEEARGRFTLQLWDASGTRTVTLGG